MNNREAVNWLINISADIGKAEHSDLWHYEQALTEIKNMLESTQPEIIHCGKCKHYKIDHPKANGYHCCYRCHNIFPMKETDFCSKAERRTDGEKQSD